MLNRQNTIIAGLILLAIISRVLPHPPNFAPITAVALFGGALFTNRGLAFLVPLAAMLVSDAIIGFHSHVPVIYGLFILTVLIGFALRDRISLGSVAAASIGSSILFFLGSNFVVWYGSSMYAQTWDGLMMSYTMAIPFFQNSLLGDLFYSGVLFGAWAWAKQRHPEWAIGQ